MVLGIASMPPSRKYHCCMGVVLNSLQDLDVLRNVRDRCCIPLLYTVGVLHQRRTIFNRDLPNTGIGINTLGDHLYKDY